MICLARNPEQPLREVAVSVGISERAVDAQIVTLRRKLGDYGDLVRTVRAVGYRLDV